MDVELAVKAAMNNALWCDAVSRAHGVPTSIGPDVWMGRELAPRLYPNLVTLFPTRVEEQIRRVCELRRTLRGSGWAVKDSFKSLDLVPHGFRPMFDAQWVCFNELDGPGRPSPKGLVVRCVDSVDGLRGWESAWSDGQSEHERAVRVFLPVLLENPDIAFLSVMDGAEVVAGFVANRGGGVVGVSNLFTRSGDWWILSPCLAQAAAFWPDLQMVGYVSGKKMHMVHRRLGFGNVIGGLRIWRASDWRSPTRSEG